MHHRRLGDVHKRIATDVHTRKHRGIEDTKINPVTVKND
jgi:hypothetical protein